MIKVVLNLNSNFCARTKSLDSGPVQTSQEKGVEIFFFSVPIVLFLNEVHEIALNAIAFEGLALRELILFLLRQRKFKFLSILDSHPLLCPLEKFANFLS